MGGLRGFVAASLEHAGGRIIATMVVVVDDQEQPRQKPGGRPMAALFRLR